MTDPKASEARIRPVRRMRGSAAISAELFTSTADPLVIAFQTSALFYDQDRDPALTLPALRQRWAASERKASAARRTLIDLGYWVQVDARQPGGTWRRETLFGEIRLTFADLEDVAAQFAPTSSLDCGGDSYVISKNGVLVKKTAGGTDTAKLQTRSDQAKQGESAGRTESAPVQTVHASSVRSTDDAKTCMHDEFWLKTTTTIGAAVDPPGRRKVHAQIATAFEAGWTPDTLSTWIARQVVTATSRLHNVPGFVVNALREIPVPELAAPSKPAEPKPLPACPTCKASEGDKPSVRSITNSEGFAKPCPDCHPLALVRSTEAA
jgi:hypothetical protein